ncbi:hypothetical protein Tco_1490769 [Tanacetum coccineum]
MAPNTRSITNDSGGSGGAPVVDDNVRTAERNGGNGQPSTYTKLAKLEFPKNLGDDVKVKNKGRMLFIGSISGTSGNARFNAQSNNTHKPLLPNPQTTYEPAPKNNRKQLTQKEYQEKRANNQCFYCDKKYTPGHKCSGQMYALEVLADNESDEECLGEEELEELREVPQISSNVMHGWGMGTTLLPVVSVNNSIGSCKELTFGLMSCCYLWEDVKRS